MLLRPLVGFGLVVSIVVSPVGAARWTSIGPDGGEIRRIVVDPLTPTTLYASTNRSLFKSTDGGTTWSGLPLPGLIYRLAIDPVTPTTLYAGVFSPLAPAAGLYKTTDGGASWVKLPAAPRNVRALAVNVTTPGRLYVGEYGKVWRSTDGGATWAVTSLPIGFEVGALASDPVNAGVLYVATFETGSAGDQVYKSTNGGVSFTPTPLIGQDVAFLAVDPVDPQVVYATGYRYARTRLWKSANGGATWNPSDTGLLSTPLNVYEAPIVVDPLAHTTVYVGTLDGVFRSIDSGATWTPASTGLAPLRVNALALDPTTPTTLWVGTFGGHLSKSTDGAGTWSTSTSGIREDSVVTLAVDPTNPAILYTGSEYNGIHKSVDAGASWATANSGLSSTQVRNLLIDPLAPGTVYALTGDFPARIARSLDGGASWSESVTGLPTDPDLELKGFALDPTAPGLLYVGTNADDLAPGAPSLYRSADSGVTWSATAALVNSQVQAIAVAPSSGRVYVGDAYSQVQVSDDGGTVWTPATSVPGFLTTLAVHPIDPMTVLAGTENGIRLSTDGGTTWAPASLSNRYITGLAIDPTLPTSAYAATDSGIFASLDGGVTWTEVSSGLASTDVAAVAVDPMTAARVYVGVYGASAYRRDLAPCATDADCDDVSVCTTGDACMPADSASSAFGCVHTAVVCPPPGECQTGAGSCNRFAGCQYPLKSDGTACTSDGTDCTTDTCQVGSCVHAPAPRLVCHEPTLAGASVLKFRNSTPTRARLSWRWTKGDVQAADIGNPFTVGASDYELCLYDRGGVAGSERFLAGIKAPAAGTCAGQSCWILGPRALKYKDRDRTPDGLDSLQLTLGPVNQGMLRSTAKGPSLVLPGTALVPRVRAQLRRDDSTTACWQAFYDTGIVKNLAGNFTRKSNWP